MQDIDNTSDYQSLYELAYDVVPSSGQIKRFRQLDTERQAITLHMLATALEDTVILQLQCLGLNVPDWMMGAAPDSDTFDRWYVRGLLNGQSN